MDVTATAKTDVGRVRERNEDAHLVHDALGLYAVADGMGGHAGGAHASSLTVATLTSFLTDRSDALAQAAEPDQHSTTPPVARLLAEAVRNACAAVFDAAAADAALAGMGTTCTVLLLRPGWAYVAHVGDSRCYLQRGTRFMQITEDHSLVNEQVRAGLLTPEAAATSRLKNIITRSVGFERDVEVDTFLVALEPGDQFLLCSDGLSNLVENGELGEAMMAMQGRALADFLVDVALQRGGDDNVTVVTVRIGDAPSSGVPTASSGSAAEAFAAGNAAAEGSLPQPADPPRQAEAADAAPASPAPPSVAAEAPAAASKGVPPPRSGRGKKGRRK